MKKILQSLLAAALLVAIAPSAMADLGPRIVITPKLIPETAPENQITKFIFTIKNNSPIYTFRLDFHDLNNGLSVSATSDCKVGTQLRPNSSCDLALSLSAPSLADGEDSRPYSQTFYATIGTNFNYGYKLHTTIIHSQQINVNTDISLSDSTSTTLNNFTVTLSNSLAPITNTVGFGLNPFGTGTIPNGTYTVNVTPTELTTGNGTYAFTSFDQNLQNPGDIVHIVYQKLPQVTARIAGLPGDITAVSMVQLSGEHSYSLTNVAPNSFNFGAIYPGSYTYNDSAIVTDPNTDKIYCPATTPITITQTPDSQSIQLNYSDCTPPPGTGIVTLNLDNDRTLKGKGAESEQTITFTNTLTQIPTAQKFTLTNGSYTGNISLPNGTYTVTLTAPDNYNVVLGASTVTVTSNQHVILYADYKATGTYVPLSPSNYQLLVSSKDQTINLGQGTLDYQCEYEHITTPPYYKHRATTERPSGCFNNGDFQFRTTLRTIGNTQITEDKLWAMATVMATMIERIQIQFGHNPYPGMPNNFPGYHNTTPLYPASSIKAIGTTPGINTLGDYMHYNISPNFLLARCLQESNSLCTINVANAPSGSFQIDSFALSLNSPDKGGYAIPFSLMQQSYVIGVPGGPFNSDTNPDKSNFVGGVISSAFFDSTNFSPQWSTDNAVQLLEIMKTSTTLPDVLEYFNSILYNQGSGALAQKFLDKNNLNYCATTNFAASNTDVRFDARCFYNDGSSGAWYPFQLPDYNHNFLEVANTKGGSFYDSPLTWKEISAFLDLIGPQYYGFYDSYDITQAKVAGYAAFTALAGTAPDATIQFNTQFFTVLSAMMPKLPVYLTGAPIPGGGGGDTNIQVSNNATVTFYIQSNEFNNTLAPNESTGLPLKTHVLSFQYMNPGYIPCSAQALAQFNSALANPDVTSISLGFANGNCTITTD